MEMVQGLVSVVIPTYKRNDMLPRAIESVLNQTYKNVEILVVDDNEPGDEYYLKNDELMKNYSSKPIVRRITQQHHTNGAVARNVGFKAANGEFVALLDDDDTWLPRKLEVQVGFLTKHPEVGAVSCLYEIYKDGRLIRRCQAYNNENLQKKVLLREVAICTPTFCGRTEIVLKSRGFDPTLKRHQDLQFYTDFLNVSTITPINEVFLHVYVDSNINAPNTEQLIEYKKCFFESIMPTLEKYDKSFQKRVFNAHYFEIVLTALREKKISVILKYLLKIGFSPVSYADVFKRFKSRS